MIKMIIPDFQDGPPERISRFIVPRCEQRLGMTFNPLASGTIQSLQDCQGSVLVFRLTDLRLGPRPSSLMQ
jgi:hypothetical protein